jgi:LPXTG-site transpeptidase (sortase) family protein
MTAVESQLSQLSKPMDPGVPVRIEIPKIHADAAIESVGTTTQGAVGVPEGPADAAWFDLGPRPGEEGSSIIVGHSGWKDDMPAVFDDLHKLATGDKIYVVDETAATTTFVVREVKMFGENKAAAGVFDSSDGKAHLNLITCEGTWNKAKKSYPNRLVVFADRVDTASSTP